MQVQSYKVHTGWMHAKLLDPELLKPTCAGRYAARHTSSLKIWLTESLGNTSAPIRWMRKALKTQRTAGRQAAHHPITFMQGHQL
jgi:hypothetical protein